MRVVITPLTRLLFGTLLLLSPSTLRAQQSPQRNPQGALQAFMLTSTYGVIVGTLTGLASLAFYEKPSEKSRNIAIGASLGLYVGILLGAYIVYVPALGSFSSSSQKETLDQDPIRLDSGWLHPSPQSGGPEGHLYGSLPVRPSSWTPWMNWDRERGTQLGVVYNF
jgi:hypothetical protein